MKATLNKTASNYFVFESEMRIPTGLWWRSEIAAAETHFLISLCSVNSPSPNTATMRIRELDVRLNHAFKAWEHGKVFSQCDVLMFLTVYLQLFQMAPTH